MREVNKQNEAFNNTSVQAEESPSLHGEAYMQTCMATRE